jgi:hypothetical protein
MAATSELELAEITRRWREWRSSIGVPVIDPPVTKAVAGEPDFVRDARRQWPAEVARIEAQSIALAEVLAPWLKRIATLEARVVELESRAEVRPPTPSATRASRCQDADSMLGASYGQPWGDRRGRSGAVLPP